MIVISICALLYVDLYLSMSMTMLRLGDQCATLLIALFGLNNTSRLLLVMLDWHVFAVGVFAVGGLAVCAGESVGAYTVCRRIWLLHTYLFGFCFLSAAVVGLLEGPELVFWIVIYIAWCGVGGSRFFSREAPKVEEASPHCGNCNYDLTGNESGTCPECGANVREGRLAKNAE